MNLTHVALPVLHSSTCKPAESIQRGYHTQTYSTYEAGSRTTKTTCDTSHTTKTPKQRLIPANRQPSMPATRKKQNNVEQTTAVHQKHIAQTSEIGHCHDQGLAGVELLTRTSSLLTVGVLARATSSAAIAGAGAHHAGIARDTITCAHDSGRHFFACVTFCTDSLPGFAICVITF